MTTVKLSSKNQVVIPKEARDALSVSAGDEILLVPKGDRVIIVAKGKDVVGALAGSGQKAFARSRRHLRGERASWTRGSGKH